MLRMRRLASGVLLGGVATVLVCGTCAASPSPSGSGRLLAATASAQSGCGKAASTGSSTLTLTVKRTPPDRDRPPAHRLPEVGRHAPRPQHARQREHGGAARGADRDGRHGGRR